MSWNGHPVIDLDAHIVERADRFYGNYIDPAYRDAYQRLCDAVARQTQGGGAYSLFGSRTSIIEPVEAGRPLGVRDTFGLTQRSGMEGGRKAFPPGRNGFPKVVSAPARLLGRRHGSSAPRYDVGMRDSISESVFR